jgi:uncharacterized protein (TIGR02246 family)
MGSKTAIKLIIRPHEEDWNRHDFEALCTYFTDDATFVNYIEMFWKGKKGIAAQLGAIADCCLA